MLNYVDRYDRNYKNLFFIKIKDLYLVKNGLHSLHETEQKYYLKFYRKLGRKFKFDVFEWVDASLKYGLLIRNFPSHPLQCYCIRILHIFEPLRLTLGALCFARIIYFSLLRNDVRGNLCAEYDKYISLDLIHAYCINYFSKKKTCYVLPRKTPEQQQQQQQKLLQQERENFHLQHNLEDFYYNPSLITARNEIEDVDRSSRILFIRKVATNELVSEFRNESVF